MAQQNPFGLHTEASLRGIVAGVEGIDWEGIVGLRIGDGRR